ncbi:PREDICTED: pentatricopeptide repeat-containing protein At5g15980, mitochondrial-like [Nelumbo nucifera]|uniref:Pentatricopeptide repeat-containing protein At5g15980, mitochondrial-like n=1 Tax=Nelumbo nucifera TaxID=4432 RepID=A0A1U7ZIE7_NELNU|nr:PREDICTED: pentatricopeptide repeat-containing protein At5g15980, mitochondrial-like [Nelumbo nucifera]
MRNQSRLLLRSFSRSLVRSSTIETQCSQVRKLNPQIARYFSGYSHQNVSPLAFYLESRNITSRRLSSQPALEQKDSDHILVAQIFSKDCSSDKIKDELESNNISINHDLVLSVLQNLDGSPEIARRFFDWVSETENEKLSSKIYNLMLRILGKKDCVKEFWALVEIMKKKGYGISKSTYTEVSQNFEKEEMTGDLDKLKEVFTSKSAPVEKVCSRVCNIIIREEAWNEDVEKRLRDLDVSFSSDLVAMVLKNLSPYPMKALMFFWWLEEGPYFKHNQQTYNAMIKVLGREDCIDRFWAVLDKMRDSGYELEMETYFKVLGRFYKRKLIKEAVDLYEVAMAGAYKPPVHDCTFLLHKILVSKDLDMDLFSRVLKIFTEGGNVLTKSIFDGVVKSLTSVDRLGECKKILKIMENSGFVVSDAVQSKIIYRLSSSRRLDEAYEIMDEFEASGKNPTFEAWSSLIHGYCAVGDVDKASSCFQKMVEKKGIAGPGYVFEVLVKGLCDNSRAEDASKLLSEMVSGKQLRPLHTTYKILIKNLLERGSLKEASSLLGLMKNDGFPPFLDPYISYISKSGTGDDAITFLKAMTTKRFPSTSVFIHVFEAFFRAGRHNEAHNFLAKCPGYIRSHADVLDLFYSMKNGEVAASTALVV